MAEMVNFQRRRRRGCFNGNSGKFQWWCQSIFNGGSGNVPTVTAISFNGGDGQFSTAAAAVMFQQ
jgi:hypothetical protein